MMKHLFILMCIWMPLAAVAYEQAQVGRYITVSRVPKKEQINLLSQQVHVRFNQSIRTVSDAIDYLLNISGYSLAPENKRSKELKIILTKPLPTIDREIGPLTLKAALLTIVGPAFYLKDDPINRTVNFELKNPSRLRA